MKLPPVRLRAQHVLVPTGKPLPPNIPAEPLLILLPQRPGKLAALGVGNVRRHPRWLSSELLERLVDEGCFAVTEFQQPASALRPVLSLGAGQLEAWRKREHAFLPLTATDDASLLEYPDEFRRTCEAYARKAGYRTDYICELAWMWLKNGRTATALIGAEDKRGAPGKHRNFKEVVGGPKQQDGPEYDEIAAARYSAKQRVQLIELAEKVWKNRTKGKKTREKYWIALRARCKKEGLPQPSFDQADAALDALRARKKAKALTGKVHDRYRHRGYATEICEVDSTPIQGFAQSELDANQKHRNPTFYKLIDVETQYVAAVYLSYSPPSVHVFSELLYRALVGMDAVLKSLGKPEWIKDFPRYRPGKEMWVDNQELANSKLQTAFKRHLDWYIHYAKVGEGADKGMVEGSHSKTKRSLRRETWSLPKHAHAQLVRMVRDARSPDFNELHLKLIEFTREENLRELPANRVPRHFAQSGRPLNRMERYKWDLERAPEFIRPSPDPQAVKKMVLPTDFYSVHTGRGIYIPMRYYSSPELAASGLMDEHAKGGTPQVEVATHHGSVDTVYWVRGPMDWVDCVLNGQEMKVYEGMTEEEARQHDRSMPRAEKRERLRLVRAAQNRSSAKTAHERGKARAAGLKSARNRRDAHLAGLRSAEASNQARQNAQERFGDAVKPKQSSSRAPHDTAVHDFDDQLAQTIGDQVQRRMQQSASPSVPQTTGTNPPDSGKRRGKK